MGSLARLRDELIGDSLGRVEVSPRLFDFFGRRSKGKAERTEEIWSSSHIFILVLAWFPLYAQL